MWRNTWGRYVGMRGKLSVMSMQDRLESTIISWRLKKWDPDEEAVRANRISISILPWYMWTQSFCVMSPSMKCAIWRKKIIARDFGIWWRDFARSTRRSGKSWEGWGWGSFALSSFQKRVKRVVWNPWPVLVDPRIREDDNVLFQNLSRTLSGTSVTRGLARPDTIGVRIHDQC